MACVRSTDPDAFHPDENSSVKPAKAVCAACPVLTECRSYALETDQRFGVWGGLSARQRDRIRTRATHTSSDQPGGPSAKTHPPGWLSHHPSEQSGDTHHVDPPPGRKGGRVMTQHQTLLIVAALAVIGLLALLFASHRRAKKAAQAARDTVHAVSLLGRVLIAAGVIAGGQYAVIRYAHNNITLLACVLIVPALLAAATAVKALTVTPTTIRKGR